MRIVRADQSIRPPETSQIVPAKDLTTAHKVYFVPLRGDSNQCVEILIFHIWRMAALERDQTIGLKHSVL